MFKKPNEEKSSVEIFADDQELIEIRSLLDQLLSDKHRRVEDQKWPSFYFLLDQPDGGVEWCKKALDYAEENQIIFPADAYPMCIRPVNFEIFDKVRNHRKSKHFASKIKKGVRPHG